MVLNGRRLAFVDAYASGGKSMTEAALAAGYSPRHARGRAYALMKDPDVKAAVEEIQNKVKEKAQYGLEEAVAEADELMAEARAAKQMTAAANLFTTKVKLFGLLTERISLETPISLREAIDDGLSRVARLRPPHQIIDTTAIDVIPEPVPVKDPRGDD